MAYCPKTYVMERNDSVLQHGERYTQTLVSDNYLRHPDVFVLTNRYLVETSTPSNPTNTFVGVTYVLTNTFQVLT